MRLLDKPHCKKHEVYQQNCIGCRIKAKQQREVLYISPTEANNRTYSWPIDKGYDVSLKPDHTEEAKKLLKTIYKDGAYGIRRSLQEDLETITRLLT